MPGEDNSSVDTILYGSSNKLISHNVDCMHNTIVIRNSNASADIILLGRYIC